MKSKSSPVLTALALLALSTLNFQLSTVFAQGTAFTYQGQLNNGAGPANGSYDFKLFLYDAAAAGNILAGPVTNTAVAVSNGLFTMTVDFGPDVFIGQSNWLHLAVCTNNAGTFVALSPRQQLTPTPNAIFAENVNAAGISGTIPAGNVGGTYGNAVNFNNGANSFDGSFYGDFYGATFTGGNFVGNFVGTGSSLTDIWHTEGNFGTTAGTDFVGTTDNEPLEFHVNNLRALRLEPTANTPNVSGAINVIGGASVNCAAAGVQGATIAGGGAPYYFGGGTSNRVASTFDTIGGGVNNDIELNSYEATIGGGNANSILPGAYRSTISGGWNNTIETNAPESFIGGGVGNVIQTNTGNATISGGLINTIQANSGGSTVGGGLFNTIQMGAPESFIGGGYDNQIAGDFHGNGESVITGGYMNSILTNADFSTIGGGLNNQIYGDTNDFGTGTIAGGDANVINSNSWNSFIGGGQGNQIGSGSDHTAIVGGSGNQANGIDTFIGGGSQNIIQTNNGGSVIAGGYFNQIQGWPNPNTITANTIAGGYQNFMPGALLDATIGGGVLNTNAGWFSTIPGGYENYTAGNYSFAAGNHAQALYSGDFVWADSQNTNFAATASDQVSFRCLGGVRFTSGSSGTAQTVSWTPGSGSWSFSSDRNLKDCFKTVDVASVLDKVAQLPIIEWSYKGYAQRHIGAMAQDFHALFPLNTDDKSLNETDLHGVELAAIQGLNQKLQDKDAEIADLNARLEKLEQLINTQKTERK